MGDAPDEVKIHHIGNCLETDRDCGKGVAEAPGALRSQVPQ